MPTFKKYDRVSWLGIDKKEMIGTVIRAGKTIKVIADGGVIEAYGPADCFDSTDKPVPTFPSIMDKYSVKKYRTNGGDETVQFTAQLLLDGKKIADASNTGTGGGNTYFGDGVAIEKARAEAALWANSNGLISFEALDTWLSWYVNARPYGADPKEYYADLKQATGNPA